MLPVRKVHAETARCHSQGWTDCGQRVDNNLLITRNIKKITCVKCLDFIFEGRIEFGGWKRERNQYDFKEVKHVPGSDWFSVYYSDLRDNSKYGGQAAPPGVCAKCGDFRRYCGCGSGNGRYWMEGFK